MTTNSDRQRRFEFGQELIREAGQLALDYFNRRSDLVIEQKGPQDLVSRADREVEELIRDRIGREFPEDVVVGEEAGGDYAESFWIVDPIDGTSNFLRGFPYWCVALAFAEGAEATLAFTFNPTSDVLYLAQRGERTLRNGNAVRIEDREPQQACVALAHSPKQDIEGYVEAVRSLKTKGVEHRRLGSIALSLGLLAEGVFDGVVTSGTNSWDVLGGLLLAEESGALVSPYRSVDDLGRRQPIAAATPALARIVSDISGLKLSPADAPMRVP